jgi:hypothetical protein
MISTNTNEEVIPAEEVVPVDEVTPLDEGNTIEEVKPIQTILDEYSQDIPTAAGAFKIFEGEWSTYIPGFGFGHAHLFDDGRIRWFESNCNGFFGKKVLELGPLEGAHTHMLASRGAANIVSIESNKRAFLKCLIVQNALKFKAQFLYGDFTSYLREETSSYDFILTCGVLYHMKDPVGLLRDISRLGNSVGIWTHYYDEEVINERPELKLKFDPNPEIEVINGVQIKKYRQSYLNDIDLKGFCGGSAPHSYWLTRESLFACLAALGYKTRFTLDERDHVHGPSICIYAYR